MKGYGDKVYGDIVKALISAGADVNKTDSDDRTALMLADGDGHIDIVKALISAGADVNKTDSNDRTALIWASMKGSGDMVKALISAGSDINKANDIGMTALRLAACEHHIDIAEALIVAGADINITVKSGRTALMWATKKGHERIKNTILLKQALNTQSIQDSIQYIKILFSIFPSGLGILYSSLKELSYVLNEIEPIEYCDTLKKALRHFLRLLQPSGCDMSELDQIKMSIRKHDSAVNKSFERAAMTLGLFQRKPKRGDEKLLEVVELQEKIVSMLPLDKVCMLGQAQVCRGHTAG